MGRWPRGLLRRIRSTVPGGTAPFRWELTDRDRVVSEHRRLSLAQTAAEMHHREVVRRADLFRWAALGCVGIAATLVFAALGGTARIPGAIGGLWLLLASVPRFVAALTESLPDPYRRRDPWEPSDGWNRNP